MQLLSLDVDQGLESERIRVGACGRVALEGRIADVCAAGS